VVVGFGFGVEVNDNLRNLVHEFFVHFAFLKKSSHDFVLGQTLHFKSVLDWFPIAAYLNRFTKFGDGYNFEVHVFAKSSIEIEFFLAVKPPLFQCAEIEEAKVHGFFDFVHVLIGEEHERDMSLDEFNVSWFFHIRLGLQ
jgi:hypothetical protein